MVWCVVTHNIHTINSYKYDWEVLQLDKMVTNKIINS